MTVVGAVEAERMSTNKLLIGLLAIALVVTVLAIWRGAGDDKAQPQPPTTVQPIR